MEKTGENVFLNGEFTDFSRAKVSVNDRGFLFGDGVYDYVYCCYGKILQLEEHLDRLERSAAALEINIPYKREDMRSFAWELLRRSGLSRGGLYMQVTRGVAPRVHYFPADAEPTVLMTIQEIPFTPGAILTEGVSVIIVPDDRWARCYIKSLNLIPNAVAKEKARRAGAMEAVFERSSVGIMECSSSNIFAVIKGILVTPPADEWILGGITRATVLDFAREEDLRVEERPLSREEFLNAEEVFYTSSAEGVVPVQKIGETTLDRSAPGPVTVLMMEKFRDLIEELQG